MSSAAGEFPIAVGGARRVARPATMVVAAVLLVKLVATGKEFVLAGVFGRSDAMDAYIAALLVPGLLINLAAESMCQALVPVLIRVRVQQGMESARALLADSLARLLMVLVAATAAAAATAPWWMRLLGWSFSGAKLSLALHLFYGLTPFVVLGGMAAVCRAVLNSCERYAAPELAQAIIPVMIAAGALLLGGRAGIVTLVCATVVGGAVYAAVMARMMARAGYPLRLRWGAASDASRGLVRQYGAVLLSSMVASGGLLVDQAMASSLPKGSVSALAFAGRFVSVVLTLAAGVASAALGPHFATLAAENRWRECRSSLRRWTRIAWACGIAAALPLCIGARVLVHVCLEHGAFRSDDTAVVASVLALAALQIPFFAASRVDYRLILALGRADLILYCGVLNLLLDVVLDVVLMRWLGVAGIALATSLWTVSTWIFLAACARRLMSRAETVAALQS